MLDRLKLFHSVGESIIIICEMIFGGGHICMHVLQYLCLIYVPLSSSSDSMFRVMSDILTGRGFLKTAVIVAT